MDDRGNIYDVDEATAKLLGLKKIQRDLTPKEQERRKIGKHDPCGCGSGKKYRDCCRRRTAGNKLARKAAEGAL